MLLIEKIFLYVTTSTYQTPNVVQNKDRVNAPHQRLIFEHCFQLT